MRRLRTRFRPSPAMVVACAALFVALGGTGLAASYVVSSNSQVGPGTISGHHPPSGDHANIVGGSINAFDLAPGAVTNTNLAPNAVTSGKVLDGSLTGTDVANGSLTGTDVQDGSLTGGDVQNDSLTGAQINEGTLGEVPGAQGAEVAEIGGLGRYTGDASCTPPGTAYEDCAIVTVNLPRTANVLLIGHVMAEDNTNYEAFGNCKLVTQYGDVPNTVTSFDIPDGPAGKSADNGTLAGLTGNLGPGSVDFGIDCNRTGGIDINYQRASITAVAISPY